MALGHAVSYPSHVATPETQPKSAWWLLVIIALALVTTWGFWFVLTLPQP